MRQPNTVLGEVPWQEREGRGRPARNLGKLFFRREMAHYWEVSVKLALKP